MGIMGKTKKEGKGIVRAIICSLVIFLGFIAFFSARWYIVVCGDLGFDSILYTLTAGLGGVESDLINQYMLDAFLPAAVCWVVLSLVLFVKIKKPLEISTKNDKKIKLYPFPKWFQITVSTVLCIVLLAQAAATVGLAGYVGQAFQKTDIYEKYYVDPNTAEITFPEQKRNVIFIYLESMETTFLSTEQGGGNDFNAIPELYELAKENINFSHNSDVGGFNAITGGTWTTGALVSLTSGVPLKVPFTIGSNGYSTDDTFLPGLTTLSDVLDKNGYYQTFMVGSDANFGGRKQYFEQHGADKIYDLFTAREDGIIPEDYHVWWGMEDYYLFEYAKKELLEISGRGEPFAFTMLTVDTHHIGGYVCEYCGSEHAEQYENVLSCSSKQVTAFVEWITEQDFYENTTVIVSGDHPTMDGAYIVRNTPKGYERHVYNCIINSAVTTENTKNREFATHDMFPTVLAAMGCEIEGDRLGLGTNLFSETPTLCELLGTEKLKKELQKTSDFYNEKFY